ncbi:MAG: antitoxin Xre/MbcA/ParS toxin-binding domain-containing protein [Sphingomonas oligoaromativorans]
MKPISITAAIGPRSAEAALEAAIHLFDGDVEQTVRWMSAPSPHLGASPCARAERSDEDLAAVLRFIRGLEAGVCF